MTIVIGASRPPFRGSRAVWVVSSLKLLPQKKKNADHSYSTCRATALAWIALLPTVSALLCLITPASGSAICLATRNVATESANPLITTSSSVFTDGALRRGTSAIILEATGSDDAPNATSLGRFSIGAGMHIVPRTSASTQTYTSESTHRMRHHEQPTSLDSHQQLYLLDAEPPIIASSQLHTRLHRTASNRLPARLRPAVPPACRPACPGRLVWTRPLPDRSAQRLHTDEPCHPASHSTRHKYPRNNSEKKTPIHRSNNVLQEPGGGIRAQHTWHQLWTRANPGGVCFPCAAATTACFGKKNPLRWEVDEEGGTRRHGGEIRSMARRSALEISLNATPKVRTPSNAGRASASTTDAGHAGVSRSHVIGKISALRTYS
jgi:hypothetical protein